MIHEKIRMECWTDQAEYSAFQRKCVYVYVHQGH